MLELLLGSVIAALVIVPIRFWMRANRKNTDMPRYHQRTFLEIAERLLSDMTLDDNRLLRLRAMMEDLDNVRAFEPLSAVVSAFDRAARRSEKLASGVLASPGWSALAYQHFLAVSYRRVFSGILLRATFANVLEPRTGAPNTEAIDRRLHSPGFRLA